jgi:hypothetical protein
MTTTGQKLKKLKTKKVYGFKKDQFYGSLIGAETTSSTSTGIVFGR